MYSPGPTNLAVSRPRLPPGGVVSLEQPPGPEVTVLHLEPEVAAPGRERLRAGFSLHVPRVRFRHGFSPFPPGVFGPRALSRRSVWRLAGLALFSRCRDQLSHLSSVFLQREPEGLQRFPRPPPGVLFSAPGGGLRRPGRS